MGLNVNIEIADSDLVKDLHQVRTVTIPTLTQETTREILVSSINELKQPPPLTPGNSPPPPYYERGRGMIGWGGDVIPGKESQQLTASWNWGTTPQGGWLRNMATYSGYVHDELHQTWFHGFNGWKVANTVVRRIAGVDTGAGGRIKALGDKIVAALGRFKR